MEGSTVGPEIDPTLIHTSLTTDLMDEVIAFSITSRMSFKMDSSEGNDLLSAAMAALIADARREAREAILTTEDLVSAVMTILQKAAIEFPEAACRSDVRTSCFLCLSASGLATYEALLMAARGRGA